ncbi:MAG TPA: 2-dehydropantoate 2-reductase [Burkholderiaceae bacterium]|nr:2-dehydropantoate 2-reductase [Burkholderiaceae bacterium]
MASGENHAFGAFMMKICVVGAGAIGGFMAARLAGSGHELSVIARGAHLQAMRTHGLRLIAEDGSASTHDVAATDRTAGLPPQDVVILGMKAHQVPAVAADVPGLLGAHTVVVTAQNGLPWWYFHKCGGPHEGRGLESVDPGGVIARHIPAERVIGCVVYPACEIVEPGLVRQIEGNRFPLGELDGSDTPRLRALVDAFRAAGFKSPVLTDIRAEIWLKLWGNLSFNPISALTHATLADICGHEPTRQLARTMMLEAQAIAEKLGIRFKVDVDRRIAGAQAVGQHKTSMLQDVEAGRALELPALVQSVIEMGRITDTPTPTISHVHALATLLAQTLQARHGRLRIEPQG